MTLADEVRRQEVLRRRFEAMGLAVGLLPGGRTLVVTLPLGAEPFDTPQGPRRLPAVRFVTVGHDRIKCVAPRALFHLPMIRVVDCDGAAALEARIRAAWSERIDRLGAARAWLAGLGVEADAPQGAPLWSFGLGLDDARGRGTCIEPGQVLLPSRGPLAGIALAGPAERVFDAEAGCRTAVDLELAVTARLEALARARRRVTPTRASDDTDLPAPRPLHRAPVLLVGPRLAADRTLHEALRQRGYAVRACRSGPAAVEAFRAHSFDGVIVEARLDRDEGVELVPMLREQPGIAELPIALLDERTREGRRQAAIAAGASRYLAGAPEPGLLADTLDALAAAGRRRFTRYARALSVSWAGCQEPGVTATVGRGGMFVIGAAAPPGPARYALHLPEAGRSIRVDASPVYRATMAANGPPGVGMRFHAFEPGAEPAWIAYLGRLAHADRAQAARP